MGICVQASSSVSYVLNWSIVLANEYGFIARDILYREGYEAELPAVATGSHIDAIPYSGKYDGVVGVLGALEAISVLKRSVNFTVI